MAEVIDFPPPCPAVNDSPGADEAVWECACGCSLFYVLPNGCRCSNCNKFADFTNA